MPLPVSGETSSDQPPPFPRSFPIWAGLHLGIAMVAGDILANRYHNPPGFELPFYALMPGVAVALASALVYSLLSPLINLLSATPEFGKRGAAVGLAIALGALVMGIQWGEVSPYVYSQLLRLFFFANLFCAVTGHVLLQFRSLSNVRSRKLILVVTVLTYISAAVHLAGWLYINRIESSWGYELSKQLERGLNLFGGVTFSASLCVISHQLGARLESVRWLRRSTRWVAVPLPYIALAVALSLWRMDSDSHPAFPPMAGAFVWLIAALVPIAGVASVALSSVAAIRVPLLLAGVLFLAGCLASNWVSLLDRVGTRTFSSTGGGVRHVIFVTSDALRSDVLEPYGGSEIATPNLSAFAADSIVFDEAISAASWTLPAFTSMFTGLAPGVFDPIGVRWRLGDEAQTLAERLAGEGYYTGAIGMNPLLRPRHGLDQGFRTYDFYPKSPQPRTFGAKLLSLLAPDIFRTDRSSEELKNLGLDWIERNREKDFFFWLHFWDPHTPLGPPPEFRPEGKAPPSISEPWERSMDIKSGAYHPDAEEREWIRQLYLGEVRYVDAMFGEMMDHLKQQGLYDDALIIFSSDHGEEFWDHGDFGHGQSLFHELIHVPLMIKLPGQQQKDRVTRPVWTVSIAPTILDYASIGYDAGEFSAPSLEPLCLDPEAEIDTLPIYSETAPDAIARHRWSVRFETYEFMQGQKGEASEYLYDLTKDPDQVTDIAPNQPEIRMRGRNHLHDYHESNELLRGRHEIDAMDALDLPAADLDHLRKLGYIK